MSKLQKAFKFTLQPSRTQEVLINKTVGCARFIYNRFLALRKELYTTEKKTLNYGGCSQALTQLKKEIEWLREVDKFALQNALRNLETAYKNFFADLKNPKAKRRFSFPKFKKKHGMTLMGIDCLHQMSGCNRQNNEPSKSDNGQNKLSRSLNRSDVRERN